MDSIYQSAIRDLIAHIARVDGLHMETCGHGGCRRLCISVGFGEGIGAPRIFQNSLLLDAVFRTLAVHGGTKRRVLGLGGAVIGHDRNDDAAREAVPRTTPRRNGWSTGALGQNPGLR